MLTEGFPCDNTVKCFSFAGSNFRRFQDCTYSWGLKFAVRQFIYMYHELTFTVLVCVI